MKEIAITEFRKLSKDDVLKNMPFKIVWEGEPVALVSDFKDTVSIKNLHPYAKKRIKNMLALYGGEKVDKVSANDVKAIVSDTQQVPVDEGK
ncbi:MAG: hypothetical protein LLF82_000323 [Dehalococcoides mccartyi]|uniref:hypothetical protein n=1 Tax=Dehalococcoides mccartyi TaxID=61435 RepID=UPI00242EC9F6|nr:hypothetical protein [Dehalococcoides mccartyi]MCF7634857.1 hypothetical protein [Dehalococcoides mccartyi]